jgi:heme a synthase
MAQLAYSATDQTPATKVAAPTKAIAYGWGFLAYNVGVVLWGAFVRASGSGAGCGNHWPLCNGEVIPQGPQLHTIIEFTHRITSGLALLGVFLLWILVRRVTTRGHFARRAAVAAVILMIVEALLGASLVLLEYVGANQSAERAAWLAMHFANTLLLIGSLVLTAHWLRNPSFRGETINRRNASIAAFGLLAIIITGATGAIAALGDTLVRPESLTGAIAQDFSASSHFLVRLRMLHPLIAVLSVLYLTWLVAKTASSRDARVRRSAMLVFGLAFVQVLLGMTNIALLAPVWMQIVHLLFAELLWIALVLLSARLIIPSQQPLQRVTEVPAAPA